MRRPDVALWRERALRFLTGAGATILNSISGVVRNKWNALHLETAGIGALAQITSVQLWLGVASGLGLHQPLARAVATAAGSGDPRLARNATWTALVLCCGATLVVVLALLSFAPRLSAFLLGDPAYANELRIAAIGCAGVALSGLLHGFFSGRSDVRPGLTFATAACIAGIGAAFLLVPRWGLTGAVVATSTLYVAGTVGMLLFHRRAIAATLAPWARPRLDRAVAAVLLRAGGTAVLLVLLDAGLLLVARTHYMRAHGLGANGLVQAALGLTQFIGGIFYAYLQGYAFGRVSAAGDAARIQAYTRRQWGPLVSFAACVVALAMVAATPLLHLLYSSRFDAARPLMALALYGEFGRICFGACALGALPLGGNTLWFRVGIVRPVLFTLGYAVLAGAGFGIRSLAAAYALAGVGSFGIGAALMARRGVALSGRGIALSVLLLAALTAILVLLERPFP